MAQFFGNVAFQEGREDWNASTLGSFQFNSARYRFPALRGYQEQQRIKVKALHPNGKIFTITEWIYQQSYVVLAERFSKAIS